jgi:hypothetical protein
LIPEKRVLYPCVSLDAIIFIAFAQARRAGDCEKGPFLDGAVSRQQSAISEHIVFKMLLLKANG